MVALPVMRAEIVLLALLFCWVTACAPKFKPPGASVVEPRLTDNAIVCADGAMLPLRIRQPKTDPLAVMVALHGFNDYSNFIHETAIFFAHQGVAVYAYDQRGFGATRHRGRWPGRQALADDLKTVIRLVNGRYPDIPLYLLGESMGGAVIMMALADSDPLATEGVILVAPAVWNRSSMPLPQRVLLWVTAHTLPWAKVSGKFLGIRASDNTEMLKELGIDPLVIKKSRIDTIYGLANLMDAAFDAAERFQARTLILYGENDEIIPKKPVLQMFQRLAGFNSGLQRFILYEEGYHMLLRDLQADIVRQDIITWINDPSLPLPSTTEYRSVELYRQTKGK